jgi:dephospho-CoA kinase
MPKYLIIGRAGSGKSTVSRELRRRGLDARDADEVSGLARWEDAITKRPATVADVTFVDYAKVRWNWVSAAVDALLAEPGTIFLCGGADNDLAEGGKFDRVFMLCVSPDIQVQRLSTRTDNPYGTHPEMIPHIIEEQRDLAARAQAAGAVMLDADQPVAKVAIDLLQELDKD